MIGFDEYFAILLISEYAKNWQNNVAPFHSVPVRGAKKNILNDFESLVVLKISGVNCIYFG